jgi:hypothetical protein
MSQRRRIWSVVAAVVCVLCLAQVGCESLRNHPLAGDRNVPSVPWENTRLTTPRDTEVTAAPHESVRPLGDRESGKA